MKSIRVHALEGSMVSTWKGIEKLYNIHKKEKEDGDDVYYLENTNEFVIVSTDGYIRTYFEPEDGIRYYERQ